LRLLGVGAGDEVILQAFTCVAVPEAIMATGAKPVWVDLAAGSVNLDAADLAAKVTSQTKAIIVQHTFGVPADLDAILPIAEHHGIPMVEDCCHTVASAHRQRLLGTIGAAAFWSYEWGKPVIAGIGGEVRCNDPELQSRAAENYARDFSPAPAKKSAVIAAQYIMHALLYGPRRFWAVRRAFHALGRAGVAQSNYNPVGPGVAMAADFRWQMAGFSQSRLAAARARAEAFLPGRRQQAARYTAGLRPGSVRFAAVPPGAEAVFSRFPVFAPRKEVLLAAARAANLEMAAWFATPVHPLAGDELRLVHYTPGSCPRAEAAAASLVSLPLHPRVTPAFQDRLVELINRHGSA
jgi:dTDP-4-amino-4,6-dideoxygalactose transaminase